MAARVRPNQSSSAACDPVPGALADLEEGGPEGGLEALALSAPDWEQPAVAVSIANTLTMLSLAGVPLL